MQYDLVKVVKVPHLRHAHSCVGVFGSQLLCVRKYTFAARVFKSIPPMQKGDQTGQNQSGVRRLEVWLVQYSYIEFVQVFLGDLIGHNP